VTRCSRNPRRPRWPILVALIATGAFAAGAATAATPASQTIALNQKRIPIERLVTQVGEAAGRTILFDEQVRGNVSIVAQRLVTIDEAWKILESSLSILGFSLLPSTEGNWRIAPVADAVGEAPFTASIRARPSTAQGDSFVTTLISLREATVEDAMTVLEPLAGSRVTLVPYAATSSLIASGPERAIARLALVARELDRIDELPMRLRVLRYRDVQEIEPLVESHLESVVGPAAQVEVWTDVRTNAFVVRGTRESTDAVVGFLDRLDRPVTGGGEIRILRVLHRDPQEVADLIMGLAGRGRGSGDGDRPVDGTDSATDEGASEEATPPAPSIPRTPTGLESRRRLEALAAVQARTELQQEDFSIVVDAPTRSLVVRASPEGHGAIARTLEILDQRQELVALDITVSDLRTPRGQTLGFAFHVPLTPGNDYGEVVGRLISNPGGVGLLSQPGDQSQLFGRVTRDPGVPFSFGVVPIEDTGVIDAGAFEVRNEVLIQPSLVVTSGERHEIFVGANVPVPVTEGGGSVDVGISGGGVPMLSRTTRFERKDVGIRLGIEARAGLQGEIQLDLDIEISSLVPSIAGSIEAVGPTFAEQKVKTIARLDDGETAVVAMLRGTTKSELELGVPWLSRLPFVGALFRRDIDQLDESRLVIAARARRVSTPAELVADTIRRRLAFERASALGERMPRAVDGPYAVRVTTREMREDAEAIADGLALRGHRTTVHEWSHEGRPRYDVYVLSLESLVDASEIARVLSDEGWQADPVILPGRG